MSGIAVIRRWARLVDPTVITAREALAGALGHGEALRDAWRSELFAFRWDDDPPDPRGAIGRLVRETNLVQNPNKHHLELALDGESLRPRGNAWVLVFEAGEGREVGRSIARRRLLPFPLAGSRRATLWELALAGAAADIEARARSVAVARGRHEGLLANPEFQEVRIMTAAPAARDVAAALFTAAAGENDDDA